MQYNPHVPLPLSEQLVFDRAARNGQPTKSQHVRSFLRGRIKTRVLQNGLVVAERKQSSRKRHQTYFVNYPF